MVSGRKRFHGVISVLHVELLPILFGLEVVKDMGFFVQYVESDNLLAVREINSGTSNTFPFLSLILDILSLKHFVVFMFFLMFLGLRTN